MAFFSWSKTAASNASADATINWAEGQPPASVNDSARAMMARLAEYRDDTSGLLATGGTSTAYTITTNQGLAATPTDGQLIAFTPHTTNGSSATLAADSGGAFPLQSAAGTALPAASLVQGTPYAAKFNASAGAWVMFGLYSNPFNLPVGGLLPYIGSTAPNANFALCAGQAISRTTYSVLFALVSTTFGSGDGSTTFNIPDLRGRGLFGLDNMGGSAANRITVAGGNFDGTVLGGTGGGQNGTIAKANLPSYNLTVTDPGHTHTLSNVEATPSSGGSSQAPSGNTGSNLAPSVGTATTGITVSTGGSGTALPIMPPAMVVPFILRII